METPPAPTTEEPLLVTAISPAPPEIAPEPEVVNEETNVPERHEKSELAENGTEEPKEVVEEPKEAPQTKPDDQPISRKHSNASKHSTVSKKDPETALKEKPTGPELPPKDKETKKSRAVKDKDTTKDPHDIKPKQTDAKPTALDPFPYRHYPTLHICSNRLLEMKWDKIRTEKHSMKLKSVKPTVDNSSPKPYKHLLLKLKKIQMEQERNEEIKRNNRILLERMSNIMYMEAHNPDIHVTKLPQMQKNAHRRLKESKRIESDNQKLLKRLETKQSHYNRFTFLNSRFNNLTYLANISSFPGKFLKERQEFLN